MIDQVLSQQIKNLSDEEARQLYRVSLGVIALTNDNPEGFKAFYELIHGRPLDDEIVRDFIEPIYANKAENRGTLEWAYRGSFKTTTITVTLTAFRIGHEPYKSNLLVQANDDTAGKNARQIADIIEHNEGWKIAFPHVKPDQQRGWGAQGYEVYCDHDLTITDEGYPHLEPLDYAVWRTRNSQRKDPSLVGLGYRSGSLIGMHPDGVMIVDDIHDEKNTVSELEINQVIKIVTDVIFPMMVEDGDTLVTWPVFVGTPWTDDDVYHYIRNTGEFGFVFVPVMRQVAEGTAGAVHIEHQGLNGWYVLTRPNQFGVNAIIRSYNKSGHRGFFRMFLLTLEAASDTGIKYTLFPADEIKPFEWIVVSGLDYASILESKGRTVKNRSFFAKFNAAIRPTGGAIIFSGTVKQLTQLEAEAVIARDQVMYPHFKHTYFEADGVGEQAITAMLSRNSDLKIVPVKTGGKSKKYRSETELAPLLESSKIMISDGSAPELMMLRDALDKYPHGLSDPVDGCYWVARAAQEYGAFPMLNTNGLGPKKIKSRKDHPWRVRQA